MKMRTKCLPAFFVLGLSSCLTDFVVAVCCSRRWSALCSAMLAESIYILHGEVCECPVLLLFPAAATMSYNFILIFSFRYFEFQIFILVLGIHLYSFKKNCLSSEHGIYTSTIWCSN